jgi:hypothetical protein
MTKIIGNRNMRKIEVNKIPKSKCSKCGFKFEVALDAAESGVYSGSVKPGDYLMCVNCDELFQYQGDMSLKLADWSKFDDVALRQLKVGKEVNRQMREAMKKDKNIRVAKYENDRNSI